MVVVTLIKYPVYNNDADFPSTDEYVPHSYSRSGSFDSGSPWVRSRASSVESLRKQKSFDFTDDESDIFINREKKGTILFFIATQNILD